MGLALTAGIPYPTVMPTAIAAADAAAASAALGNRITRWPSIGQIGRGLAALAGEAGSAAVAGVAAGVVAAVWPTTMGNGEMPNPADTLSQSQKDWVNAVTDKLGLPSGWLAQNLAMKQHTANMAESGALTEEDYDQVAEDTYNQAQAAGQLGVTTDTVRVTEEEKKKEDPCKIGPYSEMSRVCGAQGMQAHHIVPDYALRAGPRPRTAAADTERAANLPSLAQGMAICLSGHARVAATGNEHYAAHYTTDAAILGAGASNTVLPGTTTWDEVKEASLDGIRDAKPECYPQAVAAVNAQFAGVPPEQIMRGVIDYRSLSPAALNAVKTGSQMINGAVVP